VLHSFLILYITSKDPKDTIKKYHIPIQPQTFFMDLVYSTIHNLKIHNSQTMCYIRFKFCIQHQETLRTLKKILHPHFTLNLFMDLVYGTIHNSKIHNSQTMCYIRFKFRIQYQGTLRGLEKIPHPNSTPNLFYGFSLWYHP